MQQMWSAVGYAECGTNQALRGQSRMNELETFLPKKNECEHCGGTGETPEDARCPNCYGTGGVTKNGDEQDSSE